MRHFVFSMAALAGGAWLAGACGAVGQGATGGDAGSSSTTSIASTSTTMSGLGGFSGTGGKPTQGTCLDDLQTSPLGATGDVGCEFWAADPPFFQNENAGASTHGPCYAVFVVNTWDRPAKLTVERGGQSYDVTKFGYIPRGLLPNVTYEPVPEDGIPQDEVAILFLSHRPGVKHDSLTVSFECPEAPAVLADAAVSGSGRGEAFHIVSDTPITAHDILPFGGAQSFFPSASLLLPRTVWGQNHVAIAPPSGSTGKPWLAVVGSAEATKVTVFPAADLPGGAGLAAAPKGTATDIVLGAGEVAQWLGGDPTRTVIWSDQPVAVLTGSTALVMPSAESPGGSGMDSAHQQLPPVSALGNEYIAPGIVSRLKSNAPETVSYQIMGVVDGTMLTYDPMPPGAPATLAAGQIEIIATTQLFSVRSQDANHPFFFSQTMPGAPQGNDSKDDCGPKIPGLPLTCYLGDEDWVTLLAPPQFLKRYLFFTDPSYATTNLVVTRAKGPDGFSDVSIDCLGGTVSGFQDVGSEGRYQVAYVDLVRRMVPVQGCAQSRISAESQSPFGVMVWGTDRNASYGYPAGGRSAQINDVIVGIPK